MEDCKPEKSETPLANEGTADEWIRCSAQSGTDHSHSRQNGGDKVKRIHNRLVTKMARTDQSGSLCSIVCK